MPQPQRQRPPRRHSPHFFARDPDGGVRLRIRFTGEQASLFEEAAGAKPVLDWMHQALDRQAREDIAQARARMPKLPPPTD